MTGRKKKKKTGRVAKRAGRGDGTRTMTMAQAPPQMRIPLAAPSHRECGTELITSVATVGTYAKLLSMLVSPSNLGPRLQALSNLYEKYRFNLLEFDVHLQGPTTDSATVIQAFDTDPGDPDPAASLDGIKQMCSWAHNQSSTFLDGQPHKMVVRVNQPDSGYYTSFDTNGGDYRLSYAGQYYLYSLVGGATVTAIVYVKYDITFYEPEMEAPVMAQYAYASYTGQPAVADAWAKCGAALDMATKVKGVSKIVSALGTMLRFTQGTYLVCQQYIPTAIPATPTGYIPPIVQAYTGFLSAWSVFSSSLTSAVAGLASSWIGKLVVPAGSSVDLAGAFTTAAEGGTPTTILTVSRYGV